MLLDSNIIIYAAKPEHANLRTLIKEQSPAVSWVSLVEVLGYHQLTTLERQYFEEFFAASRMIPISEAVIKHAVTLRQIKKMSLGDSLIADTALAHSLTLVTRNDKDFGWIHHLSVLNPFLTSSETS